MYVVHIDALSLTDDDDPVTQTYHIVSNYNEDCPNTTNSKKK